MTYLKKFSYGDQQFVAYGKRHAELPQFGEIDVELGDGVCGENPWVMGAAAVSYGQPNQRVGQSDVESRSPLMRKVNLNRFVSGFYVVVYSSVAVFFY
ncbi:MAG: hypothetical protein CTY19_17140 [Methylomonas sp.]|nr:MAG: hypothetical protein CTY19_17140 [Methylomonas sp.]